MEITKQEKVAYDKKRAKAFYKVGLSMDQIARELKISKATVHYYLKGKKRKIIN